MKAIIKRYNLIIFVILSIIIGFTAELLIFNGRAIKGGNKEVELSVNKIENVIETDGKYKIEERNNKIVLDGNNQYINELKFNYKSNLDFEWKITVLTKDNETIKIGNRSADIINLANRKINNYVKEITLEFLTEDLVVSDFKINNVVKFNIIRFIIIAAICFIFFIILYYHKKFFQKIEKAYLLIALPIGIFLILLTPVSADTSNDDQVHFHRAYVLLDGESSEWTQSGRYYDKLLINAPSRFQTQEEYQEYNKYLNTHNNQKSKVTRVNEDTTISYNELVYLPQALMLKIGQILSLPFTLTMYLAKFANFLLYILLIYQAIKMIPFGKKMVFVIGLLPTALYLATQFSYDPTIIGSCILGICYFLKMKFANKLNPKEYLIFILCITWASLAKAIYCPLLLLSLLLPKEKFVNEKLAKKVKIATIILTIVFLSSFILPAMMGEMSGDARVEGTSVNGQLKFIVTHPLTYCKTMVLYTWNNLADYFFGYNALSQMGYLVMKNNGCFVLPIFMTLALLLYVTFTDSSSIKIFCFKTKTALFILLALIWCLIATALYLSWTPVGSPIIEGVQGRYFLPVLLLMLFLLKPTDDKPKKEKNSIFILLIPLVTLAFYLAYILVLLYH